MTKTRYGFSVRVISTEFDNGATNVMLDFGNACHGTFTLPSANVAVGKRVMLYMEIDNAELIEPTSETPRQGASDGGLGNG